MNTLLTPREVAEAIGVSESSLRRWVDAGLIGVSRTAGGHRRIPLHEAVRYIRSAQLAVVRPEVLGLSELNTIPAEVAIEGSQDQQILDALKRGDERQARGLILSLFLSGRPVAAIVDGPMRAALTDIGQLWQHGQEGILIEHRAVDICLAALNQIRLTFAPSDKPAPLALGGAPQADPYLLPTLAAAVVLAENGYRATNFGPDTPVELLAGAAQQHKPVLVWVSASSPPTPEVRQGIKNLVTQLAGTQTTLAVGGRCAGDLHLQAGDHVRVVHSMTELAALAAERMPQRPA